MALDVMQQIRDVSSGMIPHAGGGGSSLIPGMGSENSMAGIAPGMIVPNPVNQPEMSGFGFSNAGETGKLGLTLLGVGVLILVASNVITRGYRA